MFKEIEFKTSVDFFGEDGYVEVDGLEAYKSEQLVIMRPLGPDSVLNDTLIEIPLSSLSAVLCAMAGYLDEDGQSDLRRKLNERRFKNK